MKTFARPAASIIGLVLGAGALIEGAPAPAAQSCAVRDPKPTVYVTWTGPAAIANSAGGRFAFAFQTAVPDLVWTSQEGFRTIITAATGLDETGGDSLGWANNVGGEFLFSLQFSQDPSGRNRRVTGSLTNVQTMFNIVRFDSALPSDDAQMQQAIDAIVARESNGLYCKVVNAQVLPVRPLLSAITLNPANNLPGGRITVSVTLTDQADGRRQPGKTVTFENAAPDGSVTYVDADTDFFGVATATLDVGSVVGDGHGIVQAHFRRGDRLTNSPAAAYRVVAATGDLSLTAAQAALRVGNNETVMARLMQNSAPIQNAAIAFAASGGTVSSATVVTDATGEATTGYRTPPVNALVQVTATTPAPTPTPVSPNLSASLTFVVDGAVAFNLNAAGTVPGATSQVVADLSIGGNTLSNIPVTFVLTGPGGLSATSVTTDTVGRAETTYFAPVANSSVTVTATAVVDGQTYTKTVTIQVGSVGNDPALIIVTGGRGGIHAYTSGGIPGQPAQFSDGIFSGQSMTVDTSQAGGTFMISPVDATTIGLDLNVHARYELVDDGNGNTFGKGSYVRGDFEFFVTPKADGTLRLDYNRGWTTLNPTGFSFAYAGANLLVGLINRIPPEIVDSDIFDVAKDVPVAVRGRFNIQNGFGGVPNMTGQGRLITITFTRR